MKTIKLPITLENNENDILTEFRREYSSAVKIAYNRLLDGLKQKEIREYFKTKISYSYIDTWFIQSAIYKAMAMYDADKKLKITKKIFGSKHNFMQRTKNRITKKQYQQNRLMSILSIGEAPQTGNRKFSFEAEYLIFKPNKSTKIKVLLPKLKRNYKSEYESLVKLSKNKELPIQVELSHTHVFITFDETKLKEKSSENIVKGLFCGIDLNPNYIGISIRDDNKIHKTKLYDLKNLTGKKCNYNKLNFETIEIFHDIGRICKNYGVEFIFLEDLSFKQGNKGKGKHFNRLTQNQWNRSIPSQILSKYCKIFKVNAAYSSTIGNIIYDEYPDPIASSLEIGRRGYECIIKKSKKFYPDKIPNTKIQDRWKEADFSGVSDWKELHTLLKNSKMKYRIPVPERTVFKIFSSHKSQVYSL